MGGGSAMALGCTTGLGGWTTLATGLATGLGWGSSSRAAGGGSGGLGGVMRSIMIGATASNAVRAGS